MALVVLLVVLAALTRALRRLPGYRPLPPRCSFAGPLARSLAFSPSPPLPLAFPSLPYAGTPRTAPGPPRPPSSAAWCRRRGGRRHPAGGQPTQDSSSAAAR